MNLDHLDTEQRNKNSQRIDEVSTLEMMTIINNEDKTVASAVEKVLPDIAAAVDAVAERFQRGGRLIYCGSGTSGRLGTMDAAEILPTYGVSQERVFCIIAGSSDAVSRSVEGAEDSRELAVSALEEVSLSENDALICIAASGRTPFGLAALEYGRTVGALTVCLVCSAGSAMAELSDVSIAPVVGPEVITGSTRMKAGTAQKMVLNMLSTGVMVKCGKVYGNLMVHMLPTNEKLAQRAINIIREITGTDEETASILLKSAEKDIPTAIVMHQTGLESAQAKALLEQENGMIKNVLRRYRDANQGSAE